MAKVLIALDKLSIDLCVTGWGGEERTAILEAVANFHAIRTITADDKFRIIKEGEPPHGCSTCRYESLWVGNEPCKSCMPDRNGYNGSNWEGVEQDA